MSYCILKHLDHRLANTSLHPQLNLFLFSVLLSDLVMTLVVMPLHAIHTATVGVAGFLSCSTWMYAHLLAVAAR